MSDIIPEWFERIQSELLAAEKARTEGREGRARVCARRAAGWAVGVYQMNVLGVDQVQPSALALLQWLIQQEWVSEVLREKAKRLVVHVNEDHNLPHPEDPLEDSKDLVRELLSPLGYPLQSL
jgi:hypothetical protein